MKSLYEIANKNGVHLCYQVARSEKEAVESAKVYYGHKTASKAIFVREE